MNPVAECALMLTHGAYSKVDNLRVRELAIESLLSAKLFTVPYVRYVYGMQKDMPSFRTWATDTLHMPFDNVLLCTRDARGDHTNAIHIRKNCEDSLLMTWVLENGHICYEAIYQISTSRAVFLSAVPTKSHNEKVDVWEAFAGMGIDIPDGDFIGDDFYEWVLSLALVEVNRLATIGRPTTYGEWVSPNAKHIKRGKLPIISWHTVDISPRALVVRPKSTSKTGIKRRQGDVRGHYRHCKSGKVTFVRDHKRGDPSLGVIFKDYKVAAKRLDNSPPM